MSICSYCVFTVSWTRLGPAITDHKLAREGGKEERKRGKNGGTVWPVDRGKKGGKERKGFIRKKTERVKEEIKVIIHCLKESLSLSLSL